VGAALTARAVVLILASAAVAALHATRQAESVRTIQLKGSYVIVERDSDDGKFPRDRVTVRADTGEVQSLSTCFLDEEGSYDQLVSFFTAFVRAVDAGDSKALAALARYPLAVNGPDPMQIRNAAALLKQYDRVFNAEVVSRVRAADPQRVFCRRGSAMIGSGVVWANLERGRVSFDVINHKMPP
jgi:hypothetical protein